MSALTERITEVQMTHSRRIDPNHPGYGNCRCGFPVDLPQDHAVHVAERIEAELQLTEEWAAVHESGGKYIRRTRAEAEHDLETHEEKLDWDGGSTGRLTHIARRWVSAWSELEQ